MLLLIHIIIALTSIGFSTYLFIRPSRPGISLSYYLVGLTVASGSVLVITLHAPMLQSCMTGLVYLATVFTFLGLANYRLNKKAISNDQD